MLTIKELREIMTNFKDDDVVMCATSDNVLWYVGSIQQGNAVTTEDQPLFSGMVIKLGDEVAEFEEQPIKPN